MGNDGPSNLFDLSSQTRPKKKAKPSASNGVIPKQGKPPTDIEIRKMLGRGKELYKNLVQKIDVLFQKSGQNPEEFSNFIKNPANFSPSVWEEMQNKKEQLEIQLLGISKEELRTKKNKKALKKSTKVLKGKTLGGRKKWIDMR